MDQGVGVLDVTWESRNKMKAKTMFDAGGAMVVDIPGGEEGLDEIMGLPDFPAQLSNFLVCVPELLF